jgi:hypothetical protein
MTPHGPLVSTRSRRRKERRARRVRVALGVLAVAAAFGLGIALGQALHDNPRPGETLTFVRTVRPLPLPPRTVTVTTP